MYTVTYRMNCNPVEMRIFLTSRVLLMNSGKWILRLFLDFFTNLLNMEKVHRKLYYIL